MIEYIIDTTERRGTMAEEILDKFQAGDEGAFELLLGEYRPLVESQVKSAVRKSPELSAEYDELMQEAGMALYAAAKKYRKSAEVTFGLYAKICVRNRIVSFVRKINAAKRKSRALSDRISKANGKKHKRRFASDFGVTSGAKDASNCNDPSGATSEEQGSDPSGGHECGTKKRSVGSHECGTKKRSVGGHECGTKKRSVGSHECGTKKRSVGGHECGTKKRSVGGHECGTKKRSVGSHECGTKKRSVGSHE